MGFYRHPALFVPDRIPNGVGPFPMGAHNGEHPFDRLGSDNDTESQTHIIDLEHFGLTNLSVLLNEAENGRNRRQLFNDIANVGGDAGEIEQAIARNVNESLDGDLLLEHLHNLTYINVGWTQEFFAKRTFQGGK